MVCILSEPRSASSAVRKYETTDVLEATISIPVRSFLLKRFTGNEIPGRERDENNQVVPGGAVGTLRDFLSTDWMVFMGQDYDHEDKKPFGPEHFGPDYFGLKSGREENWLISDLLADRHMYRNFQQYDVKTMKKVTAPGKYVLP